MKNCLTEIYITNSLEKLNDNNFIGGAYPPGQGVQSVPGVRPKDVEADGQRHQEPGDRPQELREDGPGQGRQVRGVHGELRQGRQGPVFNSSGMMVTRRNTEMLLQMLSGNGNKDGDFVCRPRRLLGV